MKNCPYCAEPIQDSALKCRYCGSGLQGSVLGREWHRSRRGKKIAGVCAGLAEEFGISTTPLRLAFVLMALWGPGIILYIVMWAVMPYRDEPRVVLEHRGEALEIEGDVARRSLDRN
jgi:phage shock protein PspC (stress-responsive transcriptional regulator)